METQLAYDNKTKNLNLGFKERFVTDSNCQLKIKGVLNTRTGKHGCKWSNSTARTLCASDVSCSDLPSGEVNFKGFLGKFFLAKPRSSSGYAIAADKKQLRLGAGLHYDSRTEKYKLGLNARKNIQLGTSETWLKLSQDAFYDPVTQKPSGIGHAQLSKAIFGFTDTQDLRLLLGCDAVVDSRGNITKVPYGQIRENNWSLNTTFKNDWSIRYDL